MTPPDDEFDLETALRSTVDKLNPIFTRYLSPRSSEDRPPTLFHFTDAAGLVGILSERSLRLTHATAMNDRTETTWALERAQAWLSRESSDLPPGFAEQVRAALEGAEQVPVSLDGGVYLASFCARFDRSVHWLHYGRSGEGFAIGFDPDLLGAAPYSLVKVAYEPEKLDSILRALVAESTAALTELPELAAWMVAIFVRTIACDFKHPAFESEEEWRLIEHDSVFIPTEQLQTKFRAANGRVVPFKELKFDAAAVKEIVIGASAPIDEDDPSLRLLIRDCMGRDIPVTRSPVPVRP